MNRYQAYGLILESALPLPELEVATGKADVFLEVSPIPRAHSEPGTPISLLDASETHVHLSWGGVGELIVEEPARIQLLCVETAEDAALRLFVLGAGLGVLLDRLGYLVFHASGVAVGNRAVGFLGGKGMGKSTLAAQFNLAGFPLISDELFAITFGSDGQPMVHPGPQQFRLWSDALECWGGNLKSAVRVRTGLDKFTVPGICKIDGAVPLAIAYVLSAGNSISIYPIDPSHSLLHLVPHLYVGRFGNAIFRASRHRTQRTFSQLEQLLTRIHVRRLCRERDLRRLQDVTRCVEKDVTSELAAFSQ